MDHTEVIAQISSNRPVFESLFHNIPAEARSWKPDPTSWSLVEIVNHLYDEEREDFRVRIDHCLNEPSDRQPPSIDPAGWVTARAYASRDFDSSVIKFLEERTKSIEWLSDLDDPDWSAYFRHPKFGVMSAEYFLYNWLAHDYHHIRQVNRMKYAFLRAHAGKISLEYAGNW